MSCRRKLWLSSDSNAYDKGSILKGTARGTGRSHLTSKARLCYWWCSRPLYSNFKALKLHIIKELSLGVREGILGIHCSDLLHILGSFFWGPATPGTHPVLQSTTNSSTQGASCPTFNPLDPAASLIAKWDVAHL